MTVLALALVVLTVGIFSFGFAVLVPLLSTLLLRVFVPWWQRNSRAYT